MHEEFAAPTVAGVEYRSRRSWLCAFGLTLAFTAPGACSAGEGATPGAGRAGFDGGVQGGSGGSAGSAGTGGTLLAPPAAGGSGGQSNDAGCFATGQEVRSQTIPADIIIAVDNSLSMADEAVFVQNNLNQLFARIVQNNVDTHVVVISDHGLFGICVPPPLGTGNCLLPGADSKPPALLHVPTHIDSHDGLNRIHAAFQQYRSALRADSIKSLVIISDDNSTDPPHNQADPFISAFTALDPVLHNGPGGARSWKMHGIVSFKNAIEGCLGATLGGAGLIWREIIQKTGGVEGDLCTQNFQPVFDKIAENIIQSSTPLDCEWPIPPPPQGQSFDPNFVNLDFTPQGQGAERIYYVSEPAQCAAKGGWHFDRTVNPSRVIACPASCTRLKAATSARVDVVFGCRREDTPPE
ncbi:MAG TPA: hypothetical protein VK524_03230 [Polyangiaceae bacterium]|nr:hypothetical protein [Polyangiaceae bacterium]